MMSNWNRIPNRTQYAGLVIAACTACVFFEKNPVDDGNNSSHDEEWELVLFEDFKDSTLNPYLWNVLDRENSYNNELQYYVPEDVYIENGWLRIRSQARTYGSKTYTSGQVHTRGKFSQTYGKFEVRARLPKGQGIWPAHWMLPDDGSWPPEIDIMEMLGHEPRTVYMTNHWGDYSAGTHRMFTGSFTSDVGFSENFHTFGVEWEPDTIRWFVDDTLRHVSIIAVPTSPFFIILNTAVGGDWPGNPDQTTVFPQYHDIDYVAVYRRKE